MQCFVCLENPYDNLLSDSSIFAPVASSPMIRIIIAINSDGTIAQQRNTTDSLIFTHTTRAGITRPVEGLRPDPQSFQLYQYTFPPLRRSSQGEYRIQSSMYILCIAVQCVVIKMLLYCLGIIVDNRPQLNVSIRLDVNITGNNISTITLRNAYLLICYYCD